jgi:hypothetical protein
MGRNFADFLRAYCEYAGNQYAPAHFTKWTGLSILAGALERKVWIAEGNYSNYPNLFVLLVSGPGIGKSSAIRQGVPLLYGVQAENNNFKILEGVTTAAGLREKMSIFDCVPGKLDVFSSIYLVGREGSDSPLKNHGDDFRSMACSMYDCEERYQFTLKDKAFDIVQPVMNMLVGTTFDFLGSVIDHNSVFGGLASRFTYVIEKDNQLKGSFFGEGLSVMGEGMVNGKEQTAEHVQMKERLIQDLVQIHRLNGPFRVERNVIRICEEWNEGFKTDFNEMESERMRSLMIRKKTLFKKILMLLSVSGGNDLIIREEHAERAKELVDSVTKDNPYILSQSATVDVEGQRGTTQFLAQTIKRRGGKLPKRILQGIALAHGNDTDRLTKTLDYMIGSGWVNYDSSSGMIELLVDPDRYL